MCVCVFVCAVLDLRKGRSWWWQEEEMPKGDWCPELLELELLKLELLELE